MVLTGPWCVLALVCIRTYFKVPLGGWESGALLTGGVALLWSLWLSGFRIRVVDGVLEYRDGLYRTSRIPLGEIAQMRSEWVRWHLLGRKLEVPRLAVIGVDGEKAILINPKPFAWPDLQLLRKAVTPAD
jgi:hypothetical protein